MGIMGMRVSDCHFNIPKPKRQKNENIRLSQLVVETEAKCVQGIKQWHVDICGLLFWGWRCKRCVCVFLALVCKISVPVLAVIYISCLWVLVCIWLQRLTFLPLSYGTLLTRLECTWPCHSACQFRHSDRFEKFKPLPLQNETHVSTRRERWKYLEIFFLFFVLSILSCSSKAHSLQKTNSSHLQHANWNICWCVCSSPKVHVCMCERESGAGGYTWLGMCSCDSVPSCAERTCRADLTSWWMARNVGELYRRKFLHMYLMQCKKKKKKKVLNSSNCNIFAWS